MFFVVPAAVAAEFHTIELVDPGGDPFGCQEIETLNHLRYRTDATGVVAVHEPGLEDQAVYFVLVGGAAVAPVDGFGIAGFQTRLVPGGRTVLTLERSAPEGGCADADLQQRLLAHGVPEPAEHHAFQVVDAATQRPVPLVRLTALGREWWTDNGGHVAWFDLDAMGSDVRFEVWTHGYTYGPGEITLAPTPGGTTRLELDRDQLAERLVRQTGQGAWGQTVSLGLPVPAADPVLNGEIFGQDGGQAVPWQGGLFWMWGDTGRAAYPLGNFWMTGATAALDPEPEDGVDLAYYEDPTGWVTGIAPRFEAGPTWLVGLVALDDDELWAQILNVDGEFVTSHEGMARWDAGAERFEQRVEWPEDQVVRPYANAIRADGPDGSWVVYGNLSRVPADPASMADPTTYEAYTPWVPDGAGGYTVATLPDGRPDWQWRTDGPVPTHEHELPAEISPWSNTYDPDTGEQAWIHTGSIAWNPWRGRWGFVFTQRYGTTSMFGELWYAEGDTPVGPWSWAREIIAFDQYTFYNPYLHPWFSSRGGRRILFEGTYTGYLAAHPPTPRHDYNQFFHALDLDVPAVAIPVPFYEGPSGPISRHDAVDDAPVAFGASDREGVGQVAVRWTAPSCDPDRTLAGDGAGEIAFWAMPPGAGGDGTASLLEWTRTDGSRTWSILDPGDGAVAGPVVATVWSPRWSPDVPLSDFPMPDRADAGADLCGVTSPVGLDGSLSRMTDGITSYRWSWQGGFAEGVAPSVTLAPGVHVISLMVSGPAGDAEDTVVVEVADDPGPGPGGGCRCATVSPVGWSWLLLLAGLRRRSRGAA